MERISEGNSTKLNTIPETNTAAMNIYAGVLFYVLFEIEAISPMNPIPVFVPIPLLPLYFSVCDVFWSRVLPPHSVNGRNRLLVWLSICVHGKDIDAVVCLPFYPGTLYTL